MTNQQATIAAQFLKFVPCPIHDDHWYTADTWHVDPMQRGEPFRLPAVDDARWGAMIKDEFDQRGWWGPIWRFPPRYDVQVFRDSDVLASVSGANENAALTAAVMAIMEDQNVN